VSDRLRFILKRLVFVPLAMLAIVSIAVILIALLPGDPARLVAGELASPEQVAEVSARLGLDQPLAQRYVTTMRQVLSGDLGNSYFTGRPITEEIWRRLFSSVELIVLSMLTAAILGVTIGTVGAYFRRRFPDRLSRWTVTVAQSVPDFFLGLLLIYVLFFLLGWAPSPSGRLGFADAVPPRVTGSLFVDAALAGEWATLRSALARSVLPVLTLGFVYSAYFAKTARASVGRALQSQQIQFARACGLPERQVIRYALLESRTPILTYGGILASALIGGAAIVELVFAWNGLGQWALDSILRLDVPAVQGFVIVAGVATLLIYALLDLLVVWLDPRVHYG
jgi:ABC-type dipeptide/oligopeptide/nickel transport system permease component